MNQVEKEVRELRKIHRIKFNKVANQYGSGFWHLPFNPIIPFTNNQAEKIYVMEKKQKGVWVFQIH